VKSALLPSGRNIFSRCVKKDAEEKILDVGKEQKYGENSIMNFIIFILRYNTFLLSLYRPGQDPRTPRG
jgi:hypothetical protein